MAAGTVDTVADMVVGTACTVVAMVTAVTGVAIIVMAASSASAFYVGGSCYRTVFTQFGPRRVYVCNRYY